MSISKPEIQNFHTSEASINGRSIFVHPLRTFLISDLVFQDKKNIFASFIKIISSFIGWNFLHLNEWKVVLMAPGKVCKRIISISSTCSTSPITMKIYQQVCSVKKSKSAKFPDDISIEGVMTSQII